MSLYCPQGTCYQVNGQASKPALVLIHGVGLDHTMWQAQVQALVPDYQVITYDLLGHGLSPRADAGTSLDTLAAQLLQLLNFLALDRVHLVGFSLGGLIARVVASQHNQRLNSLIIMNSVFNRGPDLSAAILERVAQVDLHGPIANIDQALERWFSPAYAQANPSYIRQLRSQVLANHQPSYSRCYRLFGEGDNVAAAQLRQITSPTLVITGELDPGSTPAMSQALAAKIAGATATIVTNARHMMPVENAAQVNQHMRDFLALHNAHTANP